MKITCEVQTKQWHLHVEINCEVKSKQWGLYVKITCEVEAKRWLEVSKCIVHVMTCLHLYLIFVIISGCGNKVTIGDRAEFELGKNECCITCSNHLLAQDKINSKQTNFYLCHMKTIQKQMRKLYFFQTWSTWSRKKYALYMRFFCVSYAFQFFVQKNTWLLN